MTYNALDNLPLATNLREKLILEKQDIESTWNYEQYLADHDDMGEWEASPKDRIHWKQLEVLISALTGYISIGESVVKS
jgi:hypothetical protein